MDCKKSNASVPVTPQTCWSLAGMMFSMFTILDVRLQRANICNLALNTAYKLSFAGIWL